MIIIEMSEVTEEEEDEEVMTETALEMKEETISTGMKMRNISIIQPDLLEAETMEERAPGIVTTT